MSEQSIVEPLLPAGWCKTPIKDLIELNPTIKASSDLEVGFVPMPKMGKHFGEPVGFEPRRWATVSKGYSQFQDNDVLLAKITPCFENGKGGIPRGLPNGIGAGSTEYFVCRPHSGFLVPEYLTAFFRTPEFMKDGETQMTGSVGHKRVPKGFLLDTEIPLAPLPEQKRIADKLEAVLGRVDACRARLARVPDLLKRFRQSVLAAATSGRLTEDWRMQKGIPHPENKLLGEIIRVSSGKFLPARSMTGGNIPVYGGNGVNGMHGEANVQEATIVIGRVGYYCGCVHLTRELAWVTDNALIVRHDKRETDRKFLFWALQAMPLRTNDSSTAQPVISGQKIYELSMNLPHPAEQQEIVRRVETLFAFADRIEARLSEAQTTIDRLTPSTLAKAFRGELVPQDPADPPASALLARLRANRAATPAPKHRGR